MLPWLSILVLGIPATFAIERHYYIAAVEEDWNYAPSGRNLVTEDTRISRGNIENRPDRIGGIYRKAIYRGFTDDTFTHQIPIPEWAGLLGPPIKAEAGDFVFIHFKNFASASNFSVHPHGFFYEKVHEGALYLDGTSGIEKLDDAVPPGGTYTYLWKITDEHVPTDDDDDCAAYTYHSHTRAPSDVDTGLVGVAVLCKEGMLHADGRRIGADKEFYLYADVTDEGNSWYADFNLGKCGNPSMCRNLKNRGDRGFIASNRMNHINGYVYGNLPDFVTCEGERVIWYFMSINRGTHAIQAIGQTMIIEKKRTDSATLFAASVYTGYMIPTNPGRWLLYCRNLIHFGAGMSSFLVVNKCPTRYAVHPPMPHHVAPTLTRKYFLAIEEVLWDYAPGLNNMNIKGASAFLDRGPQRIGSVYKKARYVEYTDDTFTVRKQHGLQGDHYGLAGPPIRAQVGEHVVVVLNRASRPYSFLANGVSFDKNNEGAVYKNVRHDDHMSGVIVQPGASRIYEFDVPADVSPAPLNENCITYIYHSAVDIIRDIYTGLFGPLLVCKPGTLTVDGAQIGVDREFALNWMVIDENLSWYIEYNIGRFTTTPMTVNKEDANFKSSNRMRAINGRTFGTLDGLHMCRGENVRWHMYGLGGQIDHHHFSFEGNNFKYDNRNLDTSSVFPGIGRTVSMIPDEPGHLLLRDGQLGFESEGMYAWYNVNSCRPNRLKKYGRRKPQKQKRGTVRRYNIGIVELDWDYAAVKIDPIDGSSLLDPNHKGYIFVRNDPPYLGTVYRKAKYIEYTDNTFTTVKERTPEELHLGLLGPFIRGNVGDTIVIKLKNFASVPYNIVPRNVIFSDGSSISEAPPTLPGQTRVYRYFIPERSGPTPKQPNCVGSLYVSRVTPLNDTHSGLVGPFVVCKQNVLDNFGRRSDSTDKEFATGYIIFDENLSNYKDYNFRSTSQQIQKDPDFIESNLYHSINGYIYGNLKGLVFLEGEHTAWYVFGLGSIEGIHTVHFHGQLYVRKTTLTLRRDVLEVFAGTYETVEMLGSNPGTWLYHCHVAPHAMEGMEASYTVLTSDGRRVGGQSLTRDGHGMHRDGHGMHHTIHPQQRYTRQRKPIKHRKLLKKMMWSKAVI